MLQANNPAFLMYKRVVEGLNRAFTAVACLCVALIGVIVVGATLARYFGSPVIWAHDYAQIAFTYAVFLSLAPALQAGQHVTVELFEGLVPKAIRPYLNRVAAIACIIFGAIFLWYLWQLTERAFQDNRLANAAVAIPLKWILVAGPVGAMQFLLTAILRFFEDDPQAQQHT
ncbi:TRAP transporter small permease subunit [Maritimibacter sp. DP07]|uniref:TRAP transporter small permease protein n=1 Tax=Maritimibacter harenae TaxID=2606218 RepID=A0A845LWM7_9RHOB|nr:TRAP transporter small permease subunit [Maritimibacter harenae]MZR12195.1 TRAP transporter small permease subunit [Maritimibacter harenae]